MTTRKPWRDAAPIRTGAPNLGDRARLHRLLDEILDRAWLTNHGPLEHELEARLCEVVGTRHCIPVANATLGLLVAVEALVPDGEVIMPSFTFPAAAHATRLLGRRVVFADIDARRHHLDPADAAARVTERTAALVPVHLWGRACDTDAMERLADHRPVIYDAAHAFGATHRGRPIGSNGRCEVFSFHATKIVNSFEGGAVATNDDDLAARLRLAIDFGFAGRDRVVAPGINAKLSEIHAAMGIVSLELLPQILTANARNYEQYCARLHGLPGIRMATEPAGSNLSYVVIEVDQAPSGGRDATMAFLHERGIDVRRYFTPGVHRMAPYRDERPDEVLPVTESVCDRVLQLPTGLAVTEEDVDAVCRALWESVERA